MDVSTYFRRLLSSIIVFQIVFSPLANGAADTPDVALTPPSLAVTSESHNAQYEKIYNGLYDNLMGGGRANPLDYFSLLRQDFYDVNAERVKNISPSGVMIRTVNNQLRGKSFKASESLYENFDGMAPNTERFEILLQGQLVHHFRVPIEAIGILGNYIVFIEKNSFNAKDNFRHISFIDLDYFRLAKGELPIFRVPIQGDGMESINSFEIKDKVLHINNKAYEVGLLDFAANMQRVLFNVAVNNTEPGHLIRSIQALQPFIEAFNKNLIEAAKDSSDIEYKRNLELALSKQIKALENISAVTDGINEANLKKLSEAFEAPVAEAMGKVHENLKNQRTLIGSLGNFWQQTTIPRPAEVGKLKEKIVTVAVGLKKGRLNKSEFYEFASELASNRKVHFSLATLAAAASAYFFPDQSLYALKASLEMVEFIGSATFGKLADFADVSFRTAAGTLSGFNPMNVFETYIADNAWKRTAVGVSAMFSILVLVVGIPHMIVNTYYLAKDFATSAPLKWRTEEGNLSVREFVRRIIPNFVLRQQQLQKDYLAALSEDKKKNQVTADTMSNEELQKMATEFVNKMNAQNNSNKSLSDFSVKTKIWGAISLFTEVNLPSVATGSKWLGTQWKKFKDVENFAGALSHFVFSFASFTKSGVFYATTWNYFYMSRILVLHPKMALTFMFYPNFFRRSVATELGKVTPPSFWNGGTRWVWQEVGTRLSQVTNSERYATLKAFEESVVPIEKEINKEALTASLTALQKYLNYDFDKIVKLSERSGIGKKISAKDIGKLSYDARTFFATYYDIIVENSMRQYLHTQVSTETHDAPSLSREQIKDWFIDNKKLAIPGLMDAKQIVKYQTTEENFKLAYARVHESGNFLAKVGVENKHNTIRGLDSETNGKIRRFVIAEQQMKKASAMARAVRANIVALLVDKPMELALLFVLTAGIKDGPNQPLFEQMFSENSAFYLSRNVFMSYLAGLIVGIMADVWVKIQQDTRVDKLGGFDQVPGQEFANKGFMSWYRYQFTHNKNNKWWDHHKYNSEIIYHNMGPAFILMTVMGMATLGRVDLDFYFLGYMIAFFLPFSGLSLKLEQTFEIASGWVLRDVPAAIRNHPLVLEWANKRITKLRMGFQIYYKLYENVLGQFLSNLMAITTLQNGTRALSRILFGGKTLTEHIIEKTTNNAAYFPGMKNVAKACHFLFANNYNSGPLPPPPK